MGPSKNLASPNDKWPIERFLSALASVAPAPGGGAAAAVAGAMGVALGEMAGRVVLKRPKLAVRSKASIRKTVQELDRLRRYFERSVEKDAQAYAALIAVLHRSGSTRVQRQRAVRRAIIVPLGMCEAAVEALKHLKRLDEQAGPYLRADLKAARALIQAAFQSAAEMVKINLKDME